MWARHVPQWLGTTEVARPAKFARLATAHHSKQLKGITLITNRHIVVGDIQTIENMIKVWEKADCSRQTKDIMIAFYKKELEVIFDGMKVANENAKTENQAPANKPVNGCGKSSTEE